MNGLGPRRLARSRSSTRPSRTCRSSASPRTCRASTTSTGEARRGRQPAPLARRVATPSSTRSGSPTPSPRPTRRTPRRSRPGGDAYAARLAALDDRGPRRRSRRSRQANRKLVSFHEAFPYFAKAYGLEIVGSVVEVPGQDPSAGEVADAHRRDQALRGEGRLRRGRLQPGSRPKAIADGGGRQGRDQPLQRLAGRSAGRHVRGSDPLGRRPDRGRAGRSGLGSRR